jgi:hypothetical protein
LKIAEPPLYLCHAKPEAGLRPRSHALATELVCVLVDPSATQAVPPGDFSCAEQRGLGTLECFELPRNELRKTTEIRIRE